MSWNLHDASPQLGGIESQAESCVDCDDCERASTEKIEEADEEAEEERDGW